MNDQNKKSMNEEIELSVFFQGFRNFCVNLLKLLFQVLSFYKKYAIVVIILLIGGAVGGYFMNQSFQKNYKNEIIVIPNYGSTEYLYGTIDMINSKIKNKDLAFFEKIKFPSSLQLNEISIQPVKDIYALVKQEKNNIEVFKLLAEKGDLAKITSDLNTSQHFKFHKISIFRKGSSVNDNGISVLLDYLNQNQYYDEYGKVVVDNIKKKQVKNNEMIAQIDSLLTTFGKKGNNTKEQGISINQNSQLNDLVLTKEAFFQDNKKLELDLIDSGKTIKDVSIINDIIEERLIASKIISLPLLLLALFSGFFLLRYIYTYLKRTAEA
jgi:hypothetical protein